MRWNPIDRERKSLMIICFTTFPLCPHPLVWFIFIWAPIITHGYVLISKLYVYSPCVRCMCCGARFAATFLTACEWIRRVFQHSLFSSSGLFDAWALFWPPTSCFVYTCLLLVIWFSLYCLCISCYRDFNDVFIQKYSINFMWMTSLLLPVQKRLQTELSRTEQHVGNQLCWL